MKTTVSNPLLKYITEEDKTLFSLADKGTGNKITVSVKTRKCQKIHIDECSEITPIRCDWCIRDKKNGECMFIELKGNDCLHAAKQIINTIEWFKNNVSPFILHKTSYIVARSGIPRTNSQKQVAMRRMAMKVGCFLRCLHPQSGVIIFD